MLPKMEGDFIGGATPLLLAVLRRNVAAVELLLARGADVDAVDGERNSVMHFVCGAYNTSLVARLIDAGAPVNSFNGKGRTPLMIAASRANYDMIRAHVHPRGRRG